MNEQERKLLNKCFSMIVELESNEDTNYMTEQDLESICDFMRKYKI